MGMNKVLNDACLLGRFEKWIIEEVEPFTPNEEECFIGGYKKAYEDMWQTISDSNPLPKFKEVLAFNKEWIEADWNPTGIRIGYLGEMGFVSAVYDPNDEGYGACFEDGDDYDTFQNDESGVEHTFYNNGDERGNIEGHRPNMPTHFMEIPNPEFRFGISNGLSIEDNNLDQFKNELTAKAKMLASFTAEELETELKRRINL